jgi:hypothetical protein
VAGGVATDSAAGLVVHPAMRSRNTRAATARTGAKCSPPLCAVLFTCPFFIIIPF